MKILSAEQVSWFTDEVMAAVSPLDEADKLAIVLAVYLKLLKTSKAGRTASKKDVMDMLARVINPAWDHLVTPFGDRNAKPS